MWMLLFVAVLFIASLLLAPKPKLENAKAASLSDFSFPMTDEGTPVFLFWGRVRIKAPNVLWYGDFFADPIKEKVKTGMFSSKKITVGYRYHLGIQMALGLFTGAGPTLRRLWWGDKEMWTGTSTGGTIAINDPNFMGGHKEGGGLIGTIDFNPGTFSQNPSPYLEQERNLGAGDVPGYRGLINLVFRGNTIEQTVDAFGKAVIPKAFQIGERPNLDPLSVEIEQVPNLLGFNTVGPNGDCNPMEMIYDIITSDWGRMALATSTVDLASFTAAAQTLEDEEHGIAYMVRSSQDARDVIEDVLKQIDGMIYEEPTTRKLVIKLIRNDYDVNALVEFDQTNVLEVTEFASSQWEDTYNQVRVVFPDRASDYEEKTAFAQDLSNVSMQSRVRSSEVTFAGVSNAALAQFLASRELNYLSIPITKVRIVVDRRGAQLRPGDVVKFSWPEYGISQLVCRVQQFDYGELDNNRVAIDLVQDRFAISNTIFSPPPPTLWERPPTDAPPIENSRIIELPRFLVSKIVESETTLGGDDDSSFLGYFVQQPSDSSAFFTAEVTVTGNAEYGTDVVTGTFNNTATLVNAITIEGLDEYDTTDGIQITNVQEPGQLVTVTEAEVETGANIFIIGDEIFAYRSATHLGAGVYRLNTIWRGVLDTSPRDHDAGERVWFFTDELGNFGENFFEGDEDLSAQLYNRNGFRTSIPEGPFTVDLQNRSERPYPPDQVELEGVPFLDELAEGATLDLTWHRRNRNATSITRPDAADEAPHETTEYYATVSRQNQPEEGPEYDLGTGTSGDLTDDKPGLVTLRLYSRVDGVSCLYPVYRRYISRNPYLISALISNELSLTANLRNLPPIQMDAEPIMTLTLIGDMQNIGPIELEANLDVDLVVTADMQNNEPNLLSAAFDMEMALTGDLLNYDAEQELQGTLDVDLSFTGDISIERYFEATMDVDLEMAGLITQDATTPLLEGSNDFYYTGAERRFVVPADCYAITIDAWAGGGAQAGNPTGGFRLPGGSGYSRLVLRVTPGDEIRFSIGQGGQTGVDDVSGGPGGWPDGGDGGLSSSLAAGGGGGSTHIYINDELVLVVGGGAGETGTSATGGSGGSGGGLSGGGSSGFSPTFGATQTEPGFNPNHLTVHDGVGPQGGNGWDTSITTADGAGSGGGGGYFGGAGGHDGSAGSGGSGFIIPREGNEGYVIESMTHGFSTTDGFWSHGFEDPYGVRLPTGVGTDGNDGKISIFVHADGEPYDLHRGPFVSTPTNHTTDVWRWKRFVVPADMWIEEIHVVANADSATTTICGVIFNHSVAPLVDGPGSCIAHSGFVTGVTTGQNDLPLLDPVFVRQGQTVWIGTISDIATYSNRQDSTDHLLPTNYSCSNTGVTVDPALGGICANENTWGSTNSKSNIAYGFWASGTTDLDVPGDSAIAVVPFTFPTSTGTLDITSVDLGGRIPKVALIFYGYAPADSDAASIVQGFGMVSRGSGRAQTVSATMNDNQTSSDTARSQIYNRAIHYGSPGTNTPAGEASISDWLSDGIRLNFTTVDGTARQAFAILIAGEDVEVACQRKSDWNAGDTRMDGFGFKPTFVVWSGLSINITNSTSPGTITAGSAGFGVGICDSHGNQGSIAWGQTDAQSQAGRPSNYISNAAIESSINSGAASVNSLLTLHSIDDAGFTINATNGLGSTESYIVAVRIPDMESRVLQFDSRTTTGVQNVTGAGFEPEFALLLGSSVQSYNTVIYNTDEASGLGVAAFTANDGIGLGFSNRVADPTDCNSGAQLDDFIVGRGTSPRAIAADFDGFTSDGFDLDYTAVHTTATKNLALVLGRGNHMDAVAEADTDVAGQLFNQGEGGYSMLMTRGSSWASSSTGTFFVALNNCGIGSNISSGGAELGTDIICRRDATISKLTAHITNNLKTTNVVIRFRKNAGNGNQVITVPPLTTGFFSDVTNTDSIVDGDRFCVSITTTAPSNDIAIRGIFALCKSDTGNPHVYWGLYGGETTVFNDAGASEAHYYAPIGAHSGDGDATDTAYSRVVVPVDCEVSHLRAQVFTNPRTTDTVAFVRINSVNSAVTITIPALTTGSFEDTSNTASITAGDTLGFIVTTGTGAGTLNFNHLGVMLAMDNDEWPLVAHSQVNNQGEIDNADSRREMYHALGGRLNFIGELADVTTADIELEQIPILHSFYARGLFTTLATKAGSDFVLHLNADFEDLTNTVTATGVGTFSDITNEDEIPSGTRLCVRSDRPATTFNHDYITVGLVMSNEP